MCEKTRLNKDDASGSSIIDAIRCTSMRLRDLKGENIRFKMHLPGVLGMDRFHR